MNKINNVISRLEKWIRSNNWSGYDPYDLRAKFAFISLQRFFNSKSPNINNKRKMFLQDLLSFLKMILARTEEINPTFFRKLFFVKKQIIPKAMGLLAEGYLNLYYKIQDKLYIKLSQECLNWLENNALTGWHGKCWGIPFDWQSIIFFPKNTPCAVVTVICGKAFFDYYLLSKDKKYLDICKSICDFLVNDLYIDYYDEKKICFSYTPKDKFHIHNANMLIAEFLIKIGKEIKQESLINLARNAVNYTLSCQRADGAFYYWGPPDTDQGINCIDHFHTGFILRSLYYVFINFSEDKKIYDALHKGFEFYTKNLFFNAEIPKYLPDSIYPIDIHNCAEAILCLTSLVEIFPEKITLLQNVINWIINNMFDKNGFFYYRKYPYKIIKTPYIRWGQAWMFNALTKFLQKIG